MPEFDLMFDAEDNGPLFADDDPLTFTLPDSTKQERQLFHAVDRPILPDDRVVNMQGQPRTWFVEMMAENVVEDERPAIRKLLHQGLTDGVFTTDSLTELANWLTEQRDKARKLQARKKLHRPTGAPSRSLRSSSTAKATSEDG